MSLMGSQRVSGRAFHTPISRGWTTKKKRGHTNDDDMDDEESGWSFENVMGVMMMQE